MNRFRPDGHGWQQVSPRKLLIDPFQALKEAAIPAFGGLIALVSSGNAEWLLLLAPAAVALIAAIAVIPWLTTYYRIDADRLEMHTGLFNRQKRSAHLDRVRSVDLTAGVLHRVLGLRKVEIGTGVDDEQFELDALTLPEAEALRSTVLARRRTTEATPPPATYDGPTPASDVAFTATEPAAPVELARFEWSWARFAPLSLTRLLVVAAAVGFLSQFVDDLPAVVSEDDLKDAWTWVTSFAILAVVLVVLLVAATAWCLAAMAEYVAKWWNLRLISSDGTLHLTAGLFSTRATSVEERRVRGVTLREPLLIRAAHGAEITAMTTGLSDNTPDLLPAAPLTVAQRVAVDVLGDDAPVHIRLTRHGRLARRRRYVGALFDSAFVAALVAGALWAIDHWADTFASWPVWVLHLPWVLGALVVLLAFTGAEASYRHLGHAMTTRHFVVGSGTITRRRDVLERDGIIGWVSEQSFFQRRLGLTDLVATTAAGDESVRLRDVPLPTAVALALAATPQAVAEFVTQG